MIELKVSLQDFPQLYQKLQTLKIDSPEERKLYRKMYYWIKEKGWPEAYFQSNLRVRTGDLLRNTTFGICGRAKYYFAINSKHAKFIWYGTLPSRGRYIPKYVIRRKGKKITRGLGKRVSKRNMEKLAEKYGWSWVGWHPGVSPMRYPLRINTEHIMTRYARKAFVRWYIELIRRT